ncbi:hypothetical protein [Lysinibacillus sp. FSL K6-4013]|uniref:hypothetical protein n=1 Tax=Lysinibacillus sp. FSL K6-4013 TaxID=2921504 RepID=UPI00315AD2C0
MLKVVNVNIYDIICFSFDPVYMALQQLVGDEEMFIDKFYEIENGNMYECFIKKESAIKF